MSLHASTMTVAENLCDSMMIADVPYLKAKPLATMTLHFLLSLTANCSNFASDVFVVVLSVEDGDHSVNLMQFGTASIGVRQVKNETVCAKMDDMFMLIPNLLVDERTKSLPDVTQGGFRSYIGRKVGKGTSVCVLAKSVNSADDTKTFEHKFKKAMEVFAEQLDEMRHAHLVEEQLRIARLEAEGRQIQLDAGRFVQHEVKNGILGALADLDGFLDGNFEAGEQRRLREEEAFKTLALSPLGVARRLGADASVSVSASATPVVEQLQQRATHAQQVPSSFSSSDSTACAEEPSTGELDCLAASPAVLATVGMVRDSLRATLDTVLSNQMVCSVLNGTYVRALERVSVGSVVAGILGVPCKLVVKPARFVLDSDSKLLRFILVNAISNAAKYGAKRAPIEIVSSTTGSSGAGGDARDARDAQGCCEVTIEIINAPGARHELLLALPDANTVFEQGTRFHDDGSKLSAGDGAWIVQKCATALGGRCSLVFEPDRTCFKLTMRARVLEPPDNFAHQLRVPSTPSSPTSNSQGDPPPPTPFRRGSFSPPSSTTVGVLTPAVSSLVSSTSQPDLAAAAAAAAADAWKLPESAVLVGLDDSPSQRNLLTRLFARCRCRERLVFGGAADCIDTFVADMFQRVTDSPPDQKFVVLLDEHLIISDGEHITTADGVELGVELRAKLRAAHLEHKTLLLARSANDSPEDLANFNAKLHGALPKILMSFKAFNAQLREHWIGRFGVDQQTDDLLTPLAHNLSLTRLQVR